MLPSLSASRRCTTVESAPGTKIGLEKLRHRHILLKGRTRNEHEPSAVTVYFVNPAHFGG